MSWEWSEFHLAWPWALLLLGLMPFVVTGYVAQQRRQLEAGLRFSQVALIASLKQQPARWRRLAWPLCVLLALICLVLAASRPTVLARVPVRSVDLMMVMDISLSMMAEDLPPNRLAAAKKAGIEFINSLPKEVRVGLALFAGDTYVASPPVSDHRQVASYLNSLQLSDLQPRTEIGSALQVALKTLAASDAPVDAAQAPKQDHQETQDPEKPDAQPPEKVVLLMSDGDSREGYPWDVAASHAAEQHVRVFTVGVGGAEPTTITYQGQVLPVSFNETILKEIAQRTQAQYFRVFTANDFKQVYDAVRNRAIHYETRQEELSAWLVLVALACLLSGMALSTGPGLPRPARPSGPAPKSSPSAIQSPPKPADTQITR
jgi:Ca-activated chloride channel family protein